MAEKKTHLPNPDSTASKLVSSRLIAVFSLIAAGFICLTFASGESQTPTPSSAAERAAVPAPFNAMRPAWYPFKRRPKGDVTLPRGDVRMTMDEAKTFFATRFEAFVAFAMDDPRELPYVKERLKEFSVLTHTHDPVRIATAARYNGHSMTVPADTGPSSIESGKAVITFYMPLWAEYDAWFVEQYVRDLFIQVATHELEHAHEGYWRNERDHSQPENVRTEALAWGITCDQVILPMRRMDRRSGSLETALCDEYVKHGGNASAPPFLKFISKLSPQGR